MIPNALFTCYKMWRLLKSSLLPVLLSNDENNCLCLTWLSPILFNKLTILLDSNFFPQWRYRLLAIVLSHRHRIRVYRDGNKKFNYIFIITYHFKIIYMTFLFFFFEPSILSTKAHPWDDGQFSAWKIACETQRTLYNHTNYLSPPPKCIQIISIQINSEQVVPCSSKMWKVLKGGGGLSSQKFHIV